MENKIIIPRDWGVEPQFQREEQLHQANWLWWHNNYCRLNMVHAGRLFTVNNNQSKSLSEHQRMLEGSRAKGTGILPGVSDMIFIGNEFIAFIELKLPLGEQSKVQKEFQQMVTANGHLYFVAKGHFKFRLIIIDLIKMCNEV